MAEVSYGGTGQAAVDYAKQQPPYQRNRVDSERWARIAAENAVMARKLTDIRREPPASFHAPQGYQSIREGRRKKQERSGKAQNDMPDTQHYVPPAPWPPTEPSHQTVRQSKAQRELDVANGFMAAKLRETYRHHGDSLLEKHKLGRGFDCNDRWAQRTALYDTNMAPAAAAPGGGAVRVLDLEQASVPKSLGVAHCGGCGARCFYSADGVRLMRCRVCKSAWYCSESCAKLDFQSHKTICKYASTGHWAPGGIRPTEDCWVSNAAMAEVRNDLRRRAAAVLAQGTSPASAAAASPSASSSPSSPGLRQRRQQQQQEEALPVHQQRRKPPPSPTRPSSASSVGRPQRSLAGVLEVGKEELGDEVQVVQLLESKYRQLRERELAAERELADVEYRANHGLDGPRPCMYVMKRFAEPSSSAGPGAVRRPASAGPRGGGSAGGSGTGAGSEGKRVNKKPAWQDTARFL